MEYTIEKGDLLKLGRLYSKSPRRIARITGSLINDFAFGVRHTSAEVIASKMVIRNFGFVTKHIWTEKSHTNLPIQSQKSEVGSIDAPRFTGWIEQQFGKQDRRSRIATVLARGSIKRQVKRAYRMGKNFENPKNYPGKTLHHKNVIMMQKLDRRKSMNPFIIYGHRRMKSGLYMFKGKRPKMLQSFDPHNKAVKRIPWMEIATQRYFSRVNIRNMWGSYLKRYFIKK